jgi:hypothetical protein
VAKRRQAEPGADERLLDGVRGVVLGAEDPCRQRVELVLVPFDELFERPAVAFLRASYERSVRIIHA